MALQAKGIIVWDFDGVMFRTADFKRAIRNILNKHGVGTDVWRGAERIIKKRRINFSLSGLMKILADMEFPVPERRFRADIHKHLVSCRHLDGDAEAVLRSLRKRGFASILLSRGMPSFQYKKIKIACGRGFRGGFRLIRVSPRPKHAVLEEILKYRGYSGGRVFFIDDARENLNLIKKHFPAAFVFHYGRRASLRKIAEKIEFYAEKKQR